MTVKELKKLLKDYPNDTELTINQGERFLYLRVNGTIAKYNHAIFCYPKKD
jgi:hypothetical protein